MIGRDDSEAAEHIGVKYRSGRFPYGSGKEPYQHDGKVFQDHKRAAKLIKKYRAAGFKDDEISFKTGIPAKQLRTVIAVDNVIEKQKERASIRQMAAATKPDGSRRHSNIEIATKIFGDPKKESTVRNYLEHDNDKNEQNTIAVAKHLKEILGEKGSLDVGASTELYISSALEFGVSSTKLETAIGLLQAEGYVLLPYRQEQVTNKGKRTTTTTRTSRN